MRPPRCPTRNMKKNQGSWRWARGEGTPPDPSLPLLLLMLCFGSCTAACHPFQHPECFEDFGAVVVSDGNLAASNHLCPTGTPGGSNQTMVSTSHGCPEPRSCIHTQSLAAALCAGCADAVGLPIAVQGQDSWPLMGSARNNLKWNCCRHYAILFFMWLLHSAPRISRSRRRKLRRKKKSFSVYKSPQPGKDRLVGVWKKISCLGP